MKPPTRFLVRAAVFTLLPISGRAMDATWDGGLGPWDLPGNWSGDVVPSGGDTAVIGGAFGGTATIEAGVTATAAHLVVGSSGAGTLRINGGLLGVSDTVLGDTVDGVGRITVVSGTMRNTEELTIGGSGTGTVTLNGGLFTHDLDAVIGFDADSSGTIIVNGGTWQSGGFLQVGRNGAGTLTVNGGLVAVSSVRIGSFDQVTLSGGVLETGFVEKSVSGGSITFDGGTLRATGDQNDFLGNFQPGQAVIGPGGAFISSNGYSIGIGSSLSGSGGLTKRGAGTLTLWSANSYTGGTTIAAGKLVLGDASNAGSLVAGIGGASVTLDGGDFEVVNGTVTGGTGSFGTNGGTGGAGVAQLAAGAIANSGTIRGGDGGVGSASSIGAVSVGGTGGSGVVLNAHGLLVNDGTILGGNGGIAFSALGSSQGGVGGTGVVFASSGTFINNGTLRGGDGGMSITNGVGGNGLFVSGGGRVENGAGGTISGGLSGSGVRAIGIEFTTVAGSLINRGTIVGGVNMGNFANNVVLHTSSAITEGGLNMGNSASSNLTLAGPGSQNLSVAVGTALTFDGELTKIGSGTWTIDRANTYGGGTNIQTGTLLITNVGALLSGLGSGGVTVGAAGTLAGVGTVLGHTAVAGTLAPGNSPGMMIFAGALLLQNTAIIEMELASISTFDEMTVGGLLTYEGELSITLLGGYRPEIGDTFDLFDAGSVAGGSQFNDITFDVSGYQGTVNYSTGVLTITAVPEPSLAGLVLTGSGLLALLRRRRRSGGVAA